MADQTQNLTSRAGTISRRIAATLIAGVWRNRTVREVDLLIRRRPRQSRILITSGVLALVFGLSLVAAQFGWVGMLVFWLAVILVVN